LEKTLVSSRVSTLLRASRGNGGTGTAICPDRGRPAKRIKDSHQQAGLAAGAVADDDQLSAKLGGHGCWWENWVVMGV
jgi:hypothetical protein